jgi:hypothetical protein
MNIEKTDIGDVYSEYGEIKIGPFKVRIDNQRIKLDEIEEIEKKRLFKLPKPTDPKIIDARETLDSMGITLEENPSIESADLDLEYYLVLNYTERFIEDYQPKFTRLSGTISIEMMDVNSTDPDDRESYEFELDVDLTEHYLSRWTMDLDIDSFNHIGVELMEGGQILIWVPANSASGLPLAWD